MSGKKPTFMQCPTHGVALRITKTAHALNCVTRTRACPSPGCTHVITTEERPERSKR
jgi:hypothetical protein